MESVEGEAVGEARLIRWDRLIGSGSGRLSCMRTCSVDTYQGKQYVIRGDEWFRRDEVDMHSLLSRCESRGEIGECIAMTWRISTGPNPTGKKPSYGTGVRYEIDTARIRPSLKTGAAYVAVL